MVGVMRNKRTRQLFTVPLDDVLVEGHDTFILTGVAGNFSVVCCDCDWETQGTEVATLEEASRSHTFQQNADSPPIRR